jgi:molybdate transport system ATP-binding protein
MTPAALTARVVVRRPHFVVDVAVAAEPGETVAVMGPSGAGKSTLLQALAGLVALDDGEITVDGRTLDRAASPRVHTTPARRGIVLLGQDPHLFPHLDARENVAFGPRATGVPAARARAVADEWLARVGLPGAGDRHPGRLSGGEQQRVAVARALAASPRVVLLDEPLVALDPETAAEIRGMLRAQLTGVTAVAVTHDAADAVALADRLVVVERGTVTARGPVRTVLAEPPSRFTASIAGWERREGTATVDGWEGEGMRLTAATSDVAAGLPAAAVFRPADVRLVAPGASATGNAWRARVRTIEPTLAGTRVRTDRGAADVDDEVAAALAPGDEITLAVAADRIRVLPIEP